MTEKVKRFKSLRVIHPSGVREIVGIVCNRCGARRYKPIGEDKAAWVRSMTRFRIKHSHEMEEGTPQQAQV